MMSHQSASQIQSEWTRANNVWWSETGYSPVPVLPPALRRHELVGDPRVGGHRLLPHHPLGRGPAGLDLAGLERDHLAGALARAPRRDRVHAPPPQTAAALPAILSGLKARGYKCASLPEMFHAAGLR